MGRRGPAPEPSAAKRAKGEQRPSRVNFEAPQPRQRPAKPPRDLSTEARKVWRHVIKEMPVGVILAVDQHALRCYVEAVVRYAEAQAIYQESTPLVRQRGSLVKNPLHQVVRDNGEQVRMWARELGLTPSARAGLHIDLAPGVPGGIAAELGLPPRLRVINE